jgi:uncharacterized membrane protein YbjE (DUF340 family)
MSSILAIGFGMYASYISQIYIPSLFIDIDVLILYLLYGLLLLVGIELGRTYDLKEMYQAIDVSILLLVIGVIWGTALGAALFSMFFTDISSLQGILITAGYGYYSLSSIMIEQAGYADLALLSILCNMFREIGTIVSAVVLYRWSGSAGLIASSGAAADVLVPVITKKAGKLFAIPALCVGVILTLLVPFIVQFLLNLL